MPGRVLGSQTMGVYRLTIPEVVQASLNPKARNGSTSFKAQRPKYLGDVYRDLPLDGPLEPSFSDDDYSYVSSVFTAASSTRTTSSTDDDSVLVEFASRAGSLDGPAFPKRHSTACCTDMAYRRELRKRYEQTSALQDTTTNSFAMSLSFRRELDVEDVDQNLALWEETSIEYVRPVRNVHPAPHSWHAGDTAASSGSSRNKSKSKKKSFLNGLLSGLNFSTSRRLRKSAS